MAWCPVCKCEYKEGVKKCADCKVNLVETLESVTVSEEDKIQMLSEEVVVPALEEEITPVRVQKKTGVYRKSAELSSDNKASAYILLSIGILGIVALVLIWLDILPFYNGIVAKISSAVILGTLFVVFIVMGVISLKNAKKFEEKAVVEGDLAKEIKDYFAENYSADSIESYLSSNAEWNEMSEELKYFHRTDYMKNLITDKFMNLDEDYVDCICDEIYAELFEE